MEETSSEIPQLALLGCGIFARDAYIPILKDLKAVLSLRFVWSRSEVSATRLLARVHQFAPEAQAEWGEEGMERILSSPQVHCCAVVLPILSQPKIVLKVLRSGKHVLQEKPIAGSKWRLTVYRTRKKGAPPVHLLWKAGKLLETIAQISGQESSLAWYRNKVIWSSRSFESLYPTPAQDRFATIVIFVLFTLIHRSLSLVSFLQLLVARCRLSRVHLPDFVSCVCLLPALLGPGLLCVIRTTQLFVGLSIFSAAMAEAIESIRTVATERNLHNRRAPFWAVAENFRFEPAFVEAHQMIKALGTMVFVQVNIEVPMNCSNKYFHNEWRRDPTLKGAFITDCGVHYVAALRTMLGGCNVVSVAAMATHRDPSVPPPDNLTTLLTLENGCSGTMIISFSSPNNKSTWRVVSSEGTVEVERGFHENKLGYTVKLITLQSKSSSKFIPVQGLQEELKAFAEDVLKSRTQVDHTPDFRSSPLQALQDLAIIESALLSGGHKDAPLLNRPPIISNSYWSNPTFEFATMS